MNVKKMTLTLSTLLILVQPSYATDPATAAAVACSALALGTMFTGGSQKEIQKLRNQIAVLERDINGQEQAVGLGRPAIPGFKKITSDGLMAINQRLDAEMKEVRDQIAALQKAKDAPCVSQQDLQALREQLARELPQFRTDIDALKAGLDRLKALEETNLGARIVALEEFKVRQEQDLAALLVDDKK